MENTRLLKLFYAAALADAAYYYGKHGIFTEVTKEKKIHQHRSADTQLKQLGIEKLEQLYSEFSDIFGCASWNYNESDVPEAITTSCMLCAIAKKQGAEKPCEAFCINPFTAFAENLGFELEVKSTLWDGPECFFSHKAN